MPCTLSSCKKGHSFETRNKNRDCPLCAKERSRQYRLRNPEKRKKQKEVYKTSEQFALTDIKYRTSVKGRAAHLLSRSRARARKRDIPFTISQQWVENKLATGLCEITGLPFSIKITGEVDPFSPSLDQIFAGKGYTPDNTRLVLWCYNSAKGTWNDETVLLMARALVSRA